MNKLMIKSSKDVSIKYSELCDCDEIYIVGIEDCEFVVSYRYWDEMIEPQVWILGDEKDLLIGTTKKLTKTNKESTIKSMVISYLLGSSMLKIEE